MKNIKLIIVYRNLKKFNLWITDTIWRITHNVNLCKWYWWFLFINLSNLREVLHASKQISYSFRCLHVTAVKPLTIKHLLYVTMDNILADICLIYRLLNPFFILFYSDVYHKYTFSGFFFHKKLIRNFYTNNNRKKFLCRI